MQFNLDQQSTKEGDELEENVDESSNNFPSNRRSTRRVLVID
jgi:hypothetical protein